jgi:hypothetical protein
VLRGVPWGRHLPAKGCVHTRSSSRRTRPMRRPPHDAQLLQVLTSSVPPVAASHTCTKFKFRQTYSCTRVVYIVDYSCRSSTQVYTRVEYTRVYTPPHTRVCTRVYTFFVYTTASSTAVRTYIYLLNLVHKVTYSTCRDRCFFSDAFFP